MWCENCGHEGKTRDSSFLQLKSVASQEVNSPDTTERVVANTYVIIFTGQVMKYAYRYWNLFLCLSLKIFHYSQKQRGLGFSLFLMVTTSYVKLAKPELWSCLREPLYFCICVGTHLKDLFHGEKLMVTDRIQPLKLLKMLSSTVQPASLQWQCRVTSFLRFLNVTFNYEDWIRFYAFRVKHATIGF